MPRKKNVRHEILIVCSWLFVTEIPVAAPTATYSSSEEPTGEFNQLNHLLALMSNQALYDKISQIQICFDFFMRWFKHYNVININII